MRRKSQEEMKEKDAVVKAGIRGESITVAGRVDGDIIAEKELKLQPPAYVTGNITTPRLSIVDGAVIDGECRMSGKGKGSQSSKHEILTADELAKYLEVDTSMIFEWAKSGKIPATKERDSWKFDRTQVDEWIANGKVK
jgi:excisionase family DNA binding protein